MQVLGEFEIQTVSVDCKHLWDGESGGGLPVLVTSRCLGLSGAAESPAVPTALE